MKSKGQMYSPEIMMVETSKIDRPSKSRLLHHFNESSRVFVEMLGGALDADLGPSTLDHGPNTFVSFGDGLVGAGGHTDRS